MILDIIVIVLVIISGFIGIKKGLVNVVVKIVGFILAAILACTCYQNVANYLYENYTFGQKINNSVREFISSEENVQNNEEEYINLTKIIDKFKLQDRINLDEEQENLDEGLSLTDVVADKITGYIMNIIAFLGIFIAVIIIAAIVGIILSAVCLIPGLKQVNKIGGFAIEIILAILKLWIVLGIISILSPMSFMSWVVTQIDKSILVDFLYDNNLLVGLISKIKI